MRSALPGTLLGEPRAREHAEHEALERGALDARTPALDPQRVAASFDTPVDPLQLIWLVARDREAFVNF